MSRWKLSTKVPVFCPVDSKESKWEVLRLRIKGTKMESLTGHLVRVADIKILSPLITQR